LRDAMPAGSCAGCRARARVRRRRAGARGRRRSRARRATRACAHGRGRTRGRAGPASSEAAAPHLRRQGKAGRAGGSIRPLRRGISVLRGRLRGLERQRATRRKSRRRSETPVIALAGYTNAGKSTLLNALTGADVSVRDRLFETLDPTTRGFEVDGRKYLLTDTVGFIRKLPHQLVEGFAATLEETLVADLILHVADASAGDDELDEMRAAVDEVLADIGSEVPVELVLNKIDLVDPLARRRL